MKLVVLVAALTVAAVLSACGTSSVSGEAARVIQGKVADYDGPAGVLEARDDRSRVSVGTGTIDAAGRFRLELEDMSERSGTSLIPGECPDLRVSDTDVGGFTVTEIDVIAGGDLVGNLVQGAVSGNAENSTITSVARTYADREVSVEGTCAPLSTDGESVTTYDLNYEAGWNIVLTEISVRSNISAIFSTDTTVSAAEIDNIGWSYDPDTD